jgi:hypothetical protein
MEIGKKALVEIRPVENRKWHGKDGKESFSQPITIRVLYDHVTGAYATGLTEEQEQEYGGRLGVDLSRVFNPQKPHPYWDSAAAKIKLPNYPIFLDPTIPLEFVRIQNLKASNLVANSIKDYNTNKYPEATHVIFDESEEIEIKATRIQLKKKCYQLINDLSTDRLTDILTIISEKTIRGRSRDFIDVQLEEIVEYNTELFLKYASMDSQETYVRASILEALYKNILTKEGIGIYYMGDKIANSYEDAIAYFLDPQNQTLKVSILEKLTVS